MSSNVLNINILVNPRQVSLPPRIRSVDITSLTNPVPTSIAVNSNSIFYEYKYWARVSPCLTKLAAWILLGSIPEAI